MRLPKSSLVAAACLLAATTSFAYQNIQVLDPTETVTVINGGGTLSNSVGDPGKINNVLYNPAGGSLIQVTPDVAGGLTLTINSEYATTLEAIFQDLGTTDVTDMVTNANGIVTKTDVLGTGLPIGGNVTKVGGGVLQINSGTAISGGVRVGFVGPAAFASIYPYVAGAGSTGQTPLDLGPQITGDPDGRNAYRVNGLQGTFTVDQGTVRLAGFLNMWHDFGAGDVTVIPGIPPTPPPAVVETADNANAAGPAFVPPSPDIARRMTGVREIVLNGSSVIEFTNSPLNTPNRSSTSLAEGSALRLNFLHNVHAGSANDQFRTEIIAGTTDDYRIVMHIDQGVDGSVGILAGAGSYIKSGAGSLTILNESRFTGDFTAAGGLTILDSAGGRALASAASFSLAGIQDAEDRVGDTATESDVGYSRRGQNVRYLQAQVDINADGFLETIYKEAYSPDPGTHTLTQSGGVWSETSTGASLEIRQDQTIHNFQSNFALKAAPSVTTTVDGVVRGTAASAIQNAADNIGKGEPVIAGTGVGSSIQLGGHTLNIVQDDGRDGIYEGSIVSAVNFAATVTATGGLPAAPTYRVAFDVLPDTGVYRLNVTDASGTTALTDSIRVGSTSELQSALASAFGLADSAITVVADTSGAYGALAYDITLATAATINSADNLATGKVVFTGASSNSKLALNLLLNDYAETEIAQGSLVANAEALGTSRVNITGGELEIFQKQAGTLSASLIGGGTVRVVASSLIDNGSGTAIEINSTGGIGTLNFGLQQRRFTGDLIVNDGVNVSLSANTGTLNDTLLNARSITLDGTAAGVGSVLSFNNTDQVVRNLSGDALSRIDLGRGTMTLDVTSAHTFLGGISGVGSVIKTGSAAFNLTGDGRDDYTGATIVQQGSLTLGSADAIRKSSAIVLAAGTSISAGGRNQTIGALFGESGSTLSLGASTLTVGFTPARYTELGGLIASGAIDLLNLGVWTTLPLSHNYLGTTDGLQTYVMPVIETEVGAIFFDRTPLAIDAATEADFTVNNDPVTGWPVLGMVNQTKLYLSKVAYLFDGNVDGVKDGVISQAEIDRATASADTLAFAGVISGSGAAQNVRFGTTNINPLVSISKTGIETLTLTGANTFTGAAVVRQGTLQVAAGSLAAGASVYLLANSATIDLNGDGVVDATALDDGLGNTVYGFDLNRDGVFDDTDHLFDGTLAVTVANGTTASWSNTILGDGNFVKIGAGTLVLDPLSAQYTGSTTVAEGALDMTLVPSVANPAQATLGDINVADGATIILRTPASFTAASGISYVAPTGIIGTGVNDLGNFTKAGLGVLTVNGVDDGFGNLTPRIQVGGTIRVQQGVLAVDTLPNFGNFQTLSIDADAEFRLTLTATDDVQLASDITGAGTFNRLGTGRLLISQFPDPAPAAAGAGFTGTLRLAGGITELDLPGSLPNARVQLVASSTLGDTTTLVLGSGAYAFAGLTGAAGTVLDLNAPPTATTLTLTVASGTDSFLGQFIGSGNLVKEGAGSLRLAPVDTLGAPVANAINDFTVNAGKLIATVAGLGAANSVTVNAGGTLEFESATVWSDRTAPAPADIVYTANITGLGRLSKSGSGDILLSGTGNLPSGDISVLAGTLIVDDRRVGGAIPTVAVSAGATFELLLTADRSLSNQITGLGGFTVSGAHQLTLLNQPTYGGLTRLRNDADLTFGAGLDVTLPGLAADDTNDIVTLNSGKTLTIVQNTAGDFAGVFQTSGVGAANLVIQGTAAFRYTANSGNFGGFAGNITVDGGFLQVGVANTKGIALSNGGTLQIYVGALDPASAYTGSVTIANGSSELVKLGGGTLDLTAGLGFVQGGGIFERLLVQEGFARVAVDANGIVGISKLAVAGTGALEVSVTSGTSTITSAITSDIANSTGGSITKTGAGTLVLGAGVTSDAALVIAGGTLQLGVSAASGCQIGGDVTVNSGAALTGSGTLAGALAVNGTFAPGYSPGTVTVGGALSFGATSTYAVEVSGSVSDVTYVNGSFSIAPGATLQVTGWDNPATPSVTEGGAPGDRHAIVVAGGTATIDPLQRFTNLKTTAYGTASPQSLAYLVAYPGDTLGRAGEIDVIVVRATQAGSLLATSLAPGGVAGVDPALVQRLSELARVEVDNLGNVSDLTTGSFGQRLAAIAPSVASGTIRSLTGMSYLAGPGMAHLAAAGDAEEIARRLEQRRFDRGYMSVKPREFYITATSAKWNAGTESYAPNYDISRSGALAGYDRDLGTDSVIGWALALDQSKASLLGGGSIDATHARIMGYASTLLADESGYIEAGASLGYSTMSAVRSQAAFGASSSPKAFTMSAWTRLGAGLLLAPRTSFSPFVQLDVSHASQSDVREQGNVDTRLDVDAISQTAVRARAGFGLAQAWDSDRGDWRYRLSLDVAYVASLSGDTATVTAHNGGLLGAGGDINATAASLDRSGLVLAPALNFGPDNDTTYSISTEFRRLGGGDATSINLTYRRRF